MELLPCPFCGLVPELKIMESDDDEGNTAYWPTCKSCKMTGPEGDTAEEAVEFWNHRIFSS